MLGWLVDWAIVAVSAAIVREAFASKRRSAQRAERLDAAATYERPKRGAAWVPLLLAATALLAWGAGRFGYATLRNYRDCVRELGVRRTLRGVAMMTLLRLRQPRREFFKLAPVFGDLLPLALCALLYEIVPVGAFAAPIALLAASMQIAMSLDHIRPPTWFFLGTSEYEAFWVFDDLRHNWGVTALCLLDRGSADGYKFYLAEREMWQRERGVPPALFFDPTQPRFWNVRTRPDMWEHTVLLLIDYAPLIVVDLRQPSPYVLQEVMWLTEPSRIGKALFLYDEQVGLLPEYAAVLPESARVLTGHQLYAYVRMA